MNDKEWGTPVSKDKIIYRRNRLIEYQKTNQARFTPLYEIIDENILDINYMIYEIDKLQSKWNSLREWLKNKIDNFQDDVSEPILHEQMTMRVIYEHMENLDKMNELEGKKQ